MRQNDELTWTSTPVPAARGFANFSSTEVDRGEFIFFDSERVQYHTMNRTAFVVWQLCDGNRSVSDIAQFARANGHSLSEDAVTLAVIDLNEAGLLEAEIAPATSLIDRRHALKLAMAGGLGGVVLPVVTSITAPAPASAETAGQCIGPMNNPSPSQEACATACMGGMPGIYTDPFPGIPGGCCQC